MAHSLHRQNTLPMHLEMHEDNFNLLKSVAQEYYSYGAKYKSYHNWEHGTSVADTTTLILSAECPEFYDVSIVLAAIWHDAVYIAGAGEAINEYASAAALTHTWNNYFIQEDPTILQRATRIIPLTSIGNHLISQNITDDLPHQILMDADLSSLSIDYEDFINNQAHIIIENNGNPDSKEDRNKCAKFLNMLATARPYIYHTTTARNWYEAKALKNIARYAEENKL